MTKSITIIGGGYLGQRLAKRLVLDNYEVKLSFRTNKPKDDISGAQMFFCDVEDGVVKADEGLFNSDSLVISLPPGLRKGLGDKYAININALVNKALSSGVNHIIFTSSIGIYPELGVFDELSGFEVTTTKQKVLQDAEQAVISSSVKNKHVLRLAGLIGDNRHPGRFPVNMSQQNANQVVNMVMIDDVVTAIAQLIAQPDTPEVIYNLVAPHHPVKQSFYRRAQQELNKTPLNDELVHNLSSVATSETSKYVDGQLLCQHTDFQYAYDDLFNALAVLSQP